jgi:hypothetical protein
MDQGLKEELDLMSKAAQKKSASVLDAVLNDAEIVSASGNLKNLLIEIPKTHAELGPDFATWEQWNAKIEDSELRQYIFQFQTNVGQVEQAQAALNWLASLTEDYFAEWPTPRNAADVERICQTMRTRFGEKGAYIGDVVGSMRRLHGLCESRLKDLRRAAKARGVNLFGKKATAEGVPAPMSSDYIDFRDQD